MKRLPLLACFLSLLACNGASPGKEATPETAAEQVAEYHLDVIFDGLIAFVEKEEVPGQRAVWALLVQANYGKNPPDKDVPPCAKIEAGVDLAEDFPPHVAALRIKDADVKLNDVSIGGIAPILFLNGLDLRFETHLKNPTVDLNALVSRSAFEDVLGTTIPDRFKYHDKIKSVYLGNFPDALNTGHLAARVLIDFGETIKAEALDCGTGARPYGMKAKADESYPCEGNPVTVGESVKVSQGKLKNPITIILDAQNKLTVKPKNSGSKLEIEVLNILPAALADFRYNSCDPLHGGHFHPAAFRWFYYLLDNQPTPPPDCSEHFFPCEDEGGTGGGTKCPQMRMHE